MSEPTSTSVPASGDLLWPQKQMESARPHSVKSTSDADHSSPKRGQESLVTRTCARLTDDSTAEHFFSQPEFLASRQVVPGSSEARKMTAGSGTSLSACSTNRGPLGRCLKILLESTTWGSTEFFLTWSGAATKCNRSVFRLVRSIPRTDETGTGSSAVAWPTPTSRDDKGQTQNPERMDYVPNIVKATWPTPQAHDTRNQGKGRTRTATGRVQCHNGDSASANLPLQVEEMASGPATCGCLARTESFVVRLTTLSAWLMGYTEAYLRHWETASSRKSRKKLLPP